MSILLLLTVFTGAALLVNAQDYSSATSATKAPATVQVVNVASHVSPASAGGWTKSSGPGEVTFENQVADGYYLANNRPNPFNSTTEIAYAIPESGKVRLTLVNVAGSEIAVLVNNVTQPSGMYTVTFSSTGMNPGVYFYKLVVSGETTDFVDTKRMIISR